MRSKSLETLAEAYENQQRFKKSIFEQEPALFHIYDTYQAIFKSHSVQLRLLQNEFRSNNTEIAFFVQRNFHY